MNKHAIWVVLAAAALAGGCTDDSTGSGGGDQPRLTCSVEMMSMTFTYEVDVADQLLTLQPLQPDEQFLERVGDPGSTIYGTWLLGMKLSGDLLQRTELRIDPDKVSTVNHCVTPLRSATATASSPATITDTTVTILETASDVEYAN